MIRRAEHSIEKRFTIVSRSLAQDKSLSYQARGLLVYVLSKPAKWKAGYDDLRREGKIGRAALDNIIKELVKTGYVVRHRERDRRSGKLAWIMEVFEDPQPSNQCMSTSTGTSVGPTSDGGQALDIDSTCARAGSSVDLTDLRDRKPLTKTPSKRSHKPPEPEIVIDPPFHGKDFMLALTKFETVKQEIKSPLTPTSREALYCKLAKFDEETATIALAEAAAGGYKAVFPEKVRRNGNGNGHGKWAEQEYTGPVKGAPNLRVENCPDCRGSGTINFKVDGVEYGKACKHERSGVVAA